MRLTASRVALARRCAWWARPEVVVPESEASSAAEVGTALHAVAEKESEDVDEQAVDDGFRQMAWLSASNTAPPGVIEPEDAGLSLRPADRTALEQLVASWRKWWSRLAMTLGGATSREQAYALDVVTGTARELDAKHRDYSDARPNEIPGTADIVTVEDGLLVVRDYKTGRSSHRYLDHEDQLRTLGAAAALEHGAHRVRVVATHVTADEVLDDGRELDALDIAVIVHELRELHESIPTAEPRPGLHCEELYCPARAVCPVTRSLLLAAAVPIDERRRLPIVGPIQSNDQAHAVLVAVDLVEAWVANRRKEAKAFADEHGGVRAPDGRVFKGRPTKRETPRLDVAGAEAALVEALGPLVARASIVTKRSASWSSIKTAARELELPVGDVEDSARAALRAIGALKVSEFVSYEWKKEKGATR